MPNNANARREKDKKKKDKKKKTDPKPLHKEDKASQDSSSLSPSVAGKDEASLDKISLSLSSDRMRSSADISDAEHQKRLLLMEHARDTTTLERLALRKIFREEIRNVNPLVPRDELNSLLSEAMLGAALESRRKKFQSAKDALSLLPLGTVKKEDALSLCAEPKADIPLDWMKILSLTKGERVTIYEETRAAIPGADGDAFSLKYKLALWEADVKKKGGNPGRHLGNADLSSLDETDDEEDSAEDSDSSENGMKAIRDDLEKQRKVRSPSSPKENRFLAGFMKSSDKQPLDALANEASTG
jgi:hypothetical protein